MASTSINGEEEERPNDGEEELFIQDERRGVGIVFVRHTRKSSIIVVVAFMMLNRSDLELVHRPRGHLNIQHISDHAPLSPTAMPNRRPSLSAADSLA